MTRVPTGRCGAIGLEVCTAGELHARVVHVAGFAAQAAVGALEHVEVGAVEGRGGDPDPDGAERYFGQILLV
jgi:hypothetical protein